MRISDWSSDVCSSDLRRRVGAGPADKLLWIAGANGMSGAGRPGLRQFATFALPALPLAVVVFPSHAVLPGFYAQHTQIPLATIGAILILARIFDAVIDPVIGFMSDATIGRWKSRKPWLLIGAAVLAVSVVPLYMPAAAVGVVYFLGWFQIGRASCRERVCQYV